MRESFSVSRARACVCAVCAVVLLGYAACVADGSVLFWTACLLEQHGRVPKMVIFFFHLPLAVSVGAGR